MNDSILYNIDPRYGVPREHISCPGCGRVYGHHSTKVDTLTEECSSCVRKLGNAKVNLVDADSFISKCLENI